MENKHFNEKAYFGQFGGQFVPETAMFALSELESEYEKLKNDKEFFKNTPIKDNSISPTIFSFCVK